MNTNDLVNTVAIVVSVVLVMVYHSVLYVVYRKNPRLIVFGLTSSARRVFVASIMARKDAILAGTPTLMDFFGGNLMTHQCAHSSNAEKLDHDGICNGFYSDYCYYWLNCLSISSGHKVRDVRTNKSDSFRIAA
jgi:hypothetical protein